MTESHYEGGSSDNGRSLEKKKSKRLSQLKTKAEVQRINAAMQKSISEQVRENSQRLNQMYEKAAGGRLASPSS